VQKWKKVARLLWKDNGGVVEKRVAQGVPARRSVRGRALEKKEEETNFRVSGSCRLGGKAKNKQ
jgi:hypothetical protein